MKSEQDKIVEASSKCSRGQKLMIIELRKYNGVGELLIGIDTTGLWGHICYWDGGWRVSVTMAVVHKGRKEMGAQI